MNKKILFSFLISLLAFTGVAFVASAQTQIGNNISVAADLEVPNGNVGIGDSPNASWLFTVVNSSNNRMRVGHDNGHGAFIASANGNYLLRLYNEDSLSNVFEFNPNATMGVGTTANSNYSIYVPGSTAYGIRAFGSTMGGRFEDSNSSARGYVGYSSYDFLGNGTGRVDATSQMRSPIYYDRDNTSYYVNPSASGTAGVFNGSLGIGTGSPTADVHIRGAASRRLRIESTNDGRASINLHGGGVIWEVDGYESGYFRIREDGVSTPLIINSGNGFVSLGTGSPTTDRRLVLPNISNSNGRARANAWNTYSSIRWKEDIATIEGGSALEAVMGLNPVSFNWKEDYGGSADVGFIAEEVGVVIPEAVTSWDENGEYADDLDINPIVSYLTRAIQEQQIKIEELEERISQLEN